MVGVPSEAVRVMSGDRVEESVREMDCRGGGSSGRRYAVYVFVAVVRMLETVVVR